MIFSLLTHIIFKNFRLRLAVTGWPLPGLAICTPLKILHPLWDFALDPTLGEGPSFCVFIQITGVGKLYLFKFALKSYRSNVLKVTVVSIRAIRIREMILNMIFSIYHQANQLWKRKCAGTFWKIIPFISNNKINFFYVYLSLTDDSQV